MVNIARLSNARRFRRRQGSSLERTTVNNKKVKSFIPILGKNVQPRVDGAQQTMLYTRGAYLEDKVRIIGLLVKKDMATLKNHVVVKKFDKIEYYLVNNGLCQADKDHGIIKLCAKTEMLFGKQGVILLKGIARFADAIWGKTLTLY